jgi:hypothetical protein
LVEPQELHNLLTPESVSLLAFSSIAEGDSIALLLLGCLTDQIAITIEATIAKTIITNNKGFSEIKLKDKGRTG